MTADRAPGVMAVPPGYQTHIDGLRAIAVLGVVLFHARVPGFGSGFVGVDIFFVISGYLIGGQIFRDRQSGRFSYRDFYARRLRRILPALAFLLIAMLAVGLVLLTPEELRELGKEVAAAILGVSNILFALNRDYFAPGSDRLPLLMTWSLGVEEQFYIVFPIVLALVMRLRLPAFSVVVGLSIASFALSLWMLPRDPQGAFYMLHPRAWELGLGALVAIGGKGGVPWTVPVGWRREAAALVGLGLVVVATAALPDDGFPGVVVLIPTVGTAILLAAPGTWIARHLLSSWPMRAIGLISYSLYLWHWPVLYMLTILEQHSVTALAGAIVISVLLGWLSWRFVEQPFRHKGGRLWADERKTVMVAVAGIVAVGGLGAAAYVANGLPARLPADARAAADVAAQSHNNPCLVRIGGRAPSGGDICLPPAPAGGGRLILVGDSHASALAPALREQAAAAGLALAERTKSSCLFLVPALQVVPGKPQQMDECADHNRRLLEEIARDGSIRGIVVTGYWSQGINLTGADGRPVALGDAIARTLAGLPRNIPVWLIQDVPGFDFDPYARGLGAAMPLRRMMMAHAPAEGDVVAPMGTVAADPSRGEVARGAAAGGVTLIDPHHVLCRVDGCLWRQGSALLYDDSHHVSASGAALALRDLSFQGLAQRH